MSKHVARLEIQALLPDNICCAETHIDFTCLYELQIYTFSKSKFGTTSINEITQWSIIVKCAR
jgi:hypothetical protein